jgi:hypothetical protein
MVLLQPGTAPPAHYYADNLLRLLGSVEAQYSDILNREERDLMLRIRRLPDEPLRLYARLLTRKGPLFRSSRLRYVEVPSTPEALGALACGGLIETCPDGDAAAVMALFTHAELDRLCPPPPAQRRLRKPERIATLLEQQPGPLLAKLGVFDPWLCLCEPDSIACFMLLFFGDRRQDFSTFVLEDLGIRRFEPYALTPQHRLFQTRAEVERFRRYECMGEQIAQLEQLASDWDEGLAADVAAALSTAAGNRFLERRRSRLLNRLGRVAERRHAPAFALTCYAASNSEPARERRARILLKLGDRDAAAAVVQTIVDRPLSAGERAFAEQFAPRCAVTRVQAIREAPAHGGLGVRHRRRVKKLPEQHLRLPVPPGSGVERAALAALTANGGHGRHLENRLPMALLGLATWDILFAPVPGAFVNAYQDAPFDLYWPDFRHARASQFSARLMALRDPATLRETIIRRFHEKHGTANALVQWAALDSPFLERLLAAVPPAHLVAIFDHALDDLAQFRSGFPDLILLYGPGHYRLVEVKGPGDQLRREQKLWFGCFDRAGIPATVLRVVW